MSSIRLKKGWKWADTSLQLEFIWPISSLYNEINTADEARHYKNSTVYCTLNIVRPSVCLATGIIR